MSTNRFAPSRRAALVLLAGAALTGLAPGPARAQSADALRASGQAGERFDGYMEARDASVAGAVSAINAERRAIYQARAAEQGVTPDQIGKVYAQQIIERAAPGTWIKTEQGQWIRK